MMKLHKYLVSQYLFPYYATTLPWASNPSIRDTYCVGRYCHCVCKPKCYQEVEDMTRPVTIISILLNATLIPQSSYPIIHSSRCQYTSTTVDPTKGAFNSPPQLVILLLRTLSAPQFPSLSRICSNRMLKRKVTETPKTLFKLNGVKQEVESVQKLF